jgi:DNA-directed RNA polymerase subunit beta'
VNNEKRMLQEAVDALFDNGRRGRPVTGPGNRPLKSLSDMLKGKQGRFRQNLLGKRVDYSGRSVIVVGPELRLHQCGLPKQMALELFKPFVMKRLVDLNLAQNIKSAKRMVERARPQVWDVLEEVIKEHPVLLNRAPTLHRLGIQAFEPVLVEGKAIQIHPLVCTAFNADFDGDQMAVHLPLSAEAQAEARILMLSTNNILSPAHGRPIATPTQDMVLGIYYLTIANDRPEKDEGIPSFTGADEVLMALDAGKIDLHDIIRVRLPGKALPPELQPDGYVDGQGPIPRVETTAGRVLFNESFPEEFEYVNHHVQKGEIGALVDQCVARFDKATVEMVLDNLKRLGFHYSTRAGVTIGIDDVVTPKDKAKILDNYEKLAQKIESQYTKGIITDDERRQELIEIWTKATDEVKDAMERSFTARNPIYMMAYSGARGNIMQIRQIAGMRGLVANPKGEIIPRPIKANFREGMSVLEYFISTHGARKGLADTALRTADSGYLTRRLVDVAQEVIIREEDCGSDRGLPVRVNVPTPDGRTETTTRAILDTKLFGRVLAEDVKVDRKMVMPRGTLIDDAEGRAVMESGADVVYVRTVLTCDAVVGVCRMCYGRNMATGRLVDIGEAVGIIAAQSIGEPGTQLTMRTFHTGGVAGEDITHGLPRVVELFEARKPKGEAIITELPGSVAIEDDDEKKVRRITVTSDDGDQVQYAVSMRARLAVTDGDRVEVGQQLTEGSVNPHEKLRVEGVQSLQMHLADEVQLVYRSQGVTIHDKHIELIIRQMLRKVHIIEPGDTEFLPGELVDRKRFEEKNAEVVESGGEPASARPILMGITKASLATDSWLAAASFQETTRVLTEAAISGKSDPLLGLKENVIIGKLIPAGTGMSQYRNIAVRIKPEAIPEYWLARQRELQEAREAGEEERGGPPFGTITREEAEGLLGGALGSDEG